MDSRSSWRSGWGSKAVATGLAAATLMATGAVEAQQRKLPYWASIMQDKARMRVGPNTDYPTSWIYKRKNLPVKVVELYGSWRKVEDPGGAQGWMHVSQLSGTATAIIVGGEAQLREAPKPGAKVLYRAEAGVVGRISDCGGGWCAIDVNGQRGFVAKDRLWGGTE